MIPRSREDVARALVLEQLYAMRDDRARYTRTDRFFAFMFGVSIARARARARRSGANQ